MKRINSSLDNRKSGFISSVIFNRYTIFLISIWGVIYLGGLSGGRLVPFTVGLLILSLTSAYFGFISKAYDPWRHKSQTGAIIGFILTYGVAYVSGVEQNAMDTIGKQITPYPNISGVTFLPRMSKETVWGWLIDSPDSPDKIVSFYKDKKNTKGWTVKAEPPFLFLKKGNAKLTISANKRLEGSKIYYLLENNK